MNDVFLIIGIITLFVVSYFLFKLLKGKVGEKSIMFISVGLFAIAIVFFIVDGFRENFSRIGLALVLIAFALYRYKMEKKLEENK